MSAGSAGGWRSLIFVAIYNTWCMSRRSRAGKTLGRVTFCRKTTIDLAQFSLNPESGPGGSRDAPDAFRGLLGVPPELPGGAPKAPSGMILPGFFLQDSSSEIPPLRFLKESSSRIPLAGFLPQDSTSSNPP